MLGFMQQYSAKILIAGVDEVGRGAWAGPIVAAAVILSKPIHGLADSKTLSKPKRELLSEQIKLGAVAYAISELSAAVIDEIGIAEANRLVMRRAIMALSIVPTLVRVDGFSCGIDLPEDVHIKGDALFAEISAASIVAKVYRDQLMMNLDFSDARYGFASHVGYGTAFHRAKLEEHGPSLYHRMSFEPMKSGSFYFPSPAGEG